MAKAISFVRAGAKPNAEGHYTEEVYTDATDATVDTQITAVTSNGTFTGGTFSGVVCKYAKSYTGCTTNNTLNDQTTRILTPGTIATIFGTAPASNDSSQKRVIDGTTTMPLVNGANNHNVPVTNPYALATGLTGAGTITGLSGGVDGFRLTIVNLTGQNLTFANGSASSAAANRITTMTGADVATTANGAAELIYAASIPGWILLYVTA